MDQADPILKTYSAIFPGLFKPFDEMPSGLKKHVRYPTDFFKMQAETYKKYHMDNVQVFYNQEDLWQIPDEIYSENRQAMEPYYIIIKLPGEGKEEFFLMLPYTPSNKDNMIGWLAARCDMPNYGNLLVYRLPKDKLVYGPMQIEARVDQQTEISRELSLWGQRGSRVIRGNLLAIPVNDTFIYVEPVYLEARQEEMGKQPVSQTQPAPRGLFSRPQQNSTRPSPVRGSSARNSASLPELKRVIVAFSNRLVMEETLDLAFEAIFKGSITPEQIEKEGDIIPVIEGKEITGRARQALEHYKKAKEYIRQENWAEYGNELEKLEEILLDLSENEVLSE